MQKHWVGLDVGEEFTNICVLDRSDSPVLECSTGSSPDAIAAGLGGLKKSEIQAMVMETGSVALPEKLRKIGFPVSVLHARTVHRFLSIRHHKTDANDARGLAEIARLGNLSTLAIHTRSSASQELRNQLIIRNRLVSARVAARATLRSTLRNYGSEIRQLSLGTALRPQIETELDLISRSVGSSAVMQIEPLLAVCVSLASYVSALDRQMQRTAASNPVTSRFLQIPGVGPICAVSFYSAIDEPSRFRRTADVGAYLGMIPKISQSGSTTYRSRVTKAGSAMTRSHLVMAAGVMMSRAKQRCAISDWGVTLAEKVGYPKARMAVARKLAMAMLSMWKADKTFEPYPQRF